MGRSSRLVFGWLAPHADRLQEIRGLDAPSRREGIETASPDSPSKTMFPRLDAPSRREGIETHMLLSLQKLNPRV